MLLKNVEVQASLFVSNSLNSSVSSLYDCYDDGISNSGPQVCATGLRDVPSKTENVTSMLSQLMISLPVINCKNSDSDFPCNEQMYCFKCSRHCRSWSVAGSDLIYFKIFLAVGFLISYRFSIATKDCKSGSAISGFIIGAQQFITYLGFCTIS